MSDSATLCLSLAFALLHLGQYAEALVECEKAIALEPDLALAYYWQGFLREENWKEMFYLSCFTIGGYYGT